MFQSETGLPKPEGRRRPEIKDQESRSSRHLSRPETIEWLLATFNDAQEPLRTGAGGGSPSGHTGFDSKLLTMPAAWHKGSYAALEEALKNLRTADRVLYWHVSERYLRCRSATITMIVERQTTLGTLKEPRRVVVELWNPRVQRKLVQEAIRWLDSNLGPVWLPKELYAVAGHS